MKKIIILLLILTAFGFCNDYLNCNVNSTKDTVYVLCSGDADIGLGIETHNLKVNKNGNYFEWKSNWGDGFESEDIYIENNAGIRSHLHINRDQYGVESRKMKVQGECIRPIEAWNKAKESLGL